MKKIKIFFLSCVMILLVACGKDKEKDSLVVTTQNDTQVTSQEKERALEEATTEDLTKEPDEIKMASDIDEFGGNQINFLDNESYIVETNSVVIDKASKDDKSFIVYCTAMQENDMFTAMNSYILTYNFYEIGGWILDDCIIDTINMTPKDIIPQTDVESYLIDMGYTSYEYVQEEKISDTSYNYYYNTITEYAYMDTICEVVVECNYDNSYGWEIYSYINSSYNDWSKIYGTWYTEYYEGDIFHTCTVTIKDIDEQLGTITVDLTTTSDSEYGVIGTDGLSSLTTTDIVSDIQYDVPEFSRLDGCECYADIVYLTYTTAGLEVDRSYYLYWGRDVGMFKVYCMGSFETGYLQKLE